MLTIGQVAKSMKMHTSTIRYYEHEGLIPETRREAGKRIYDESIVDHLTFVYFARRAGFGIAEIRSLVVGLTSQSKPGERWRSVAEEKLTEIDQKISDLQAMKKQLKALTKCQCSSLSKFVTDVRDPQNKSMSSCTID